MKKLINVKNQLPEEYFNLSNDDKNKTLATPSVLVMDSDGSVWICCRYKLPGEPWQWNYDLSDYECWRRGEGHGVIKGWLPMVNTLARERFEIEEEDTSKHTIVASPIKEFLEKYHNEVKISSVRYSTSKHSVVITFINGGTPHYVFGELTASLFKDDTIDTIGMRAEFDRMGRMIHEELISLK